MNSKYFLYIILFALLSACSSQKTISSKWQEETINSISDIPRTAFQYSSDYKLFYLFTNDEEFLYINLKVDDQNLQKRLLLSGFTIWIDSSAKLKKYMGLKYQVNPNRMLAKPDEFQKYLPLDENGKKMSLLSYFLKNTLQEPIGFSSETGDIKYHFVQDSERCLNFQLVLPIKYFSSSSISSPIISLILESKAPVKMKQRPEGGSPQMGNGGGRSASGPRGGGRGGGGKPGGSRGDREEGHTQGDKVKDIKIEVKKLQLTNHE